MAHIHLLYGVIEAEAGIVHQYVDATELLYNRLHQRVYLVSLSDITTQAKCVFLCAADALRSSLSSTQIPSTKDQLGALLEKKFRYRLADAHGSAGNYSNFVLKLHEKFCSWL